MKRATLKAELAKYLIVGALNAVFTFGVFVTSLYGLRLHYLLSLSIAAVLGFLLTYWLNFVWVFKPEERFRFQERFAKYVVTNLAMVVVNLALLYYLVERTGSDPLRVQAVLMVAVVASNFTAAKFWSLRPSK